MQATRSSCRTACGARRLDGCDPTHVPSPSAAAGGDPLVAVPLSLVRRYYELEWDAWAGRHAAWREAAAWAAWGAGGG